MLILLTRYEEPHLARRSTSHMFAATLLSTLALFAHVPPGVFAGVHEVWWNVTYVENVNPDGLFPRRAVGVNGTWPPPPIQINSTDDLILHAYNGLGDNPTSIHHHGMFFNSTSWMDGAMGVTQCGIPPGETFTYHIPVSTSGQHGSYWTHAHSLGQYTDGLRAPFNIHGSKSEEPYAGKYDDEYTVVLGDWYHDQHAKLLKDFISIKNPGGAEPVPDAALVYFVHGQEDHYLPPIPGKYSGSGGVGFNENVTLPFEPGKTYRLRVVNTSAFAMFFFWIDGHDMRIIEVDGTDVEESPIDLLTVTVAQRYSVLVTARNDTSSNWAIHCAMDTDMFDTVPEGLNPNATSSITYNTSAPITDKGFISMDAIHDVNDTALVPTEVVPQLPPADKTLEIEVTFDTMDDGTNRAMFNAVTYNFPQTPTVLSALTLGSNATIQAAYGPLSFVIDHLEVFDIVLKNGDAGKHPFHIHGHKFQIIGRSEDYTSTDPALNPPVTEGQANPIRRDTVQVPSGHSVHLRLVADNPGVWFFHCHIEWHLEAGLALTIVEAPRQMEALAAQGHAPPSYLTDQCKMLKKPIAGNAAGNTQDVLDLKGLKVGPYPQRLGWHPRGIGAMFACVLTAVLGMATVAWYAMGGEDYSEEEMEREVNAHIDARETKGRRLFGLFKQK